MADDTLLQRLGIAAIAKLPPALQRGMQDVVFRSEDGPTQSIASGSMVGNLAGVMPGQSTINIMDRPSFQKYADQTTAHEGMHVWQNNLPPTLAAKIPADNPADPYGFGGLAGLNALRQRGGTILDLPKEQQAAMMQYRQSQGGDNAPANVRAATDPYIQDMNKLPLSSIMPTDPQAKTINTHPRPPLVPVGIPGMMYAQKTYKKGQQPDDDIDLSAGLETPQQKPAADDGIDLSAGLEDTPTAAPQSTDTRNGLQKFLDQPLQPNQADLAQHGQAYGQLDKFGRGAANAFVLPVSHPIATLTGMAQAATPDPGWRGALEAAGGPAGPMAVHTLGGLIDDARQNGIMHAAGNVAGMIAAGKAIPTGDVMGESLKSSAGKLIDRTVGVRKADVARGAQPGRAYLEGGGGPALTMRGIANQAGKIKSDTGAQLGQVYDTATQNGVRIPATDVAGALQEPISKAFAIKQGPGATGGTGDLEDYSASFRPALQKAAQSGGFTPNDLFSLKKGISDNTTWNDPTQLNLNKVRQMNTGGIGSVLSDNVPDAAPLNKIYQGTSNLARRANERASTGQFPLSQIGRKTLEGAVGTGFGLAVHHPLMSVLPLIADSTPVRTSVASGLFRIGDTVPIASPVVSRVAPFAGVSGVSRLKKRPNDNP